MARLLVGIAVVLHGLVTGVIWLAPRTPQAPFDTGHSWLFGEARTAAVPTSMVLAVGFVLAGVGLILGASWWAPIGLTTGALALLFMIAFFHPWLLAGLAINAAVVFAAASPLLTE